MQIEKYHQNPDEPIPYMEEMYWKSFALRLQTFSEDLLIHMVVTRGLVLFLMHLDKNKKRTFAKGYSS
tara:strand:- start:323 stop:526 length:204 start_codon:yes stop_codon:yes gene_type:complete